jgi:hypothetical protein
MRERPCGPAWAVGARPQISGRRSKDLVCGRCRLRKSADVDRGGPQTRLGGSAVNLRSIAANISELFRSLDKPPLAELPFFVAPRFALSRDRERHRRSGRRWVSDGARDVPSRRWVTAGRTLERGHRLARAHQHRDEVTAAPALPSDLHRQFNDWFGDLCQCLNALRPELRFAHGGLSRLRFERCHGFFRLRPQ